LKHGTISLITRGVPVIAILTEAAVAEKTVSGIREVLSRGGDVTVVVSEALLGLCPAECRRFVVPTVGGRAEVFSAATALQLLACHVARMRGLDVDKPRNLAKSVTVE
jgi:glucosamine--fructose-6-phosphate aminotransferase (isomerizing)